MQCVFTHRLSRQFLCMHGHQLCLQEASLKGCTLQLVIQHCTLAALANVHKVNHIKLSFKISIWLFQLARSRLPTMLSIIHIYTLVIQWMVISASMNSDVQNINFISSSIPAETMYGLMNLFKRVESFWQSASWASLLSISSAMSLELSGSHLDPDSLHFFTVRHFVNPATGVHTQNVESYWNRVKTKLKGWRALMHITY